MWVTRHPHVTNARATDVCSGASAADCDVQRLHNDGSTPNDPASATLL
jgi:hypothetical protein